jgi:hypothetical protein
MKSILENEKLKSFSVTNRLRAGKCLTCFEIGVYLSAQTALLIATAAFLWHPKESKSDSKINQMFEKVCNDPYTVETNKNG